ncbi:MAG: DoxX family protein [Nanoarchaeota archaeon]
MNEYANISQFLLRLGLGIMFLFTGISKLLNPSAIIGMLSGLSFPIPTFFGWILLLSEIIFGALVLIGWKVKYTIWPLVIILLVATLTVFVPQIGKDPMAMISVFFHIIGILALISISLSGAGKWAIDKR